LEIAKQPVFPFLLPACLLCFTAPPVSAARPPWRASPGHLLPGSFHASRLSIPPPSFPRAGDLSLRHAARTACAAATSPSPWPGQDRARRLLLARARALQEPQKPIPLALSLVPRSYAPERRRRSTRNAGKLTLAVDPPLQSTSARADPLASSAVSPRSSPTRIAPLSLTRAS